MALKSNLRIQVAVTFSAEDRELIRRQGIHDPTSKRDLRALTRYAVEELLVSWAQLEREIRDVNEGSSR